MGDVWNEKLPGGGTSVNPAGPLLPQGSPVLALLQSLSKGAGNAAAPGVQPTAAPARVPAMPPQMTPTTTPSGMPIPGLTPTSLTPAQAGGPEAGVTPIGYPTGQMEWKTKAAANAAAVTRTMNTIQDIVVQNKQKSFETEAAKANQAASMLIGASLVKEKMARGEQLTLEDLKSAGAAMHADPKIMKLFEKAQRDPMSGAYVGIQRAQQAAMERTKQQAEMEAQQAHAEYYRQAAQFQGERGDLEREKLVGQKSIADERAGVARDKMEMVNQTKAEGVVAKSAWEQGMIGVRKPDGSLDLTESGAPKLRPMTPEDVANNPALKLHMDSMKAKIDLQLKTGYAATLRANVAQAKEQRLAQESQQLSQPGAVVDWAKNISDPTTGITLAQVPQKGRAAVLKYMSDNGLSVAKPLTGKELERMDLSSNALNNLEKAKTILREHPEIFGPGGWFHNKAALAGAGGDPNVAAFQTAIQLANLPLVGVHGVKGKWALEDLSNLDSNLYRNPESMKEILDGAIQSVMDFQKLAGRPESVSGGRKAETSSPSAAPGKAATTLSDDEILRQLNSLPK
jgi:hypothetical protein